LVLTLTLHVDPNRDDEFASHLQSGVYVHTTGTVGAPTDVTDTHLSHIHGHVRGDWLVG
jgi:hypothetical protein